MPETRKAKNNEFYTQLSDIEKELQHYKHHFKDKTVYCNCDDPTKSNFFHYFSYNFEHLGLKKLITTCYKNQDRDLFSRHDSKCAIYLEYTGDKNGNKVPDIEEIGVKPLKGDGDFRSQGSIELLKQADIVVTNPPFSLFTEYVAQLIEYDKKFLIIGNLASVASKDIFSLIKDNKIWLGPTGGNIHFIKPDGDTKQTQVRWFTNLEYSKQHEDLILYQTYTPENYPKYAHYDAINVKKVKDIPKDYDGLMGVPITFLDKYNPDQFELITTLGQQKFKVNDVYKIKNGKITNKIEKSVYGHYVPFEGHLEEGLYDKKTGQQYQTIYNRIIIKRK